jgi:DNA-binding transcriptional MerR regulator
VLIGEVARRSGVSARMLRHYDTLGLLRQVGRTGSGYREYSGEDIERILHIESLRALGLTLREVGRALDDPGFRPSQLIDELIRQTQERIATETRLLSRLRRVGAVEPAGWEDVLQVVALLQALGSEHAGRRQRAALSSAEEVVMPVDALVEAALHEADPNVAGALRWALARSGGGLEQLARGLESPAADVRERAVRALAELPGDTATELLRAALTNADIAVRRYAALALGPRGATEAIPTLIEMVATEGRDVDAADALSALAADPVQAERIATGLVDRMTGDAVDPTARRQLTQALADIPGERTTWALTELARDPDRAVAVTAAYLLKLRESHER